MKRHEQVPKKYCQWLKLANELKHERFGRKMAQMINVKHRVNQLVTKSGHTKRNDN